MYPQPTTRRRLRKRESGPTFQHSFRTNIGDHPLSLSLCNWSVHSGSSPHRRSVGAVGVGRHERAADASLKDAEIRLVRVVVVCQEPILSRSYDLAFDVRTVLGTIFSPVTGRGVRCRPEVEDGRVRILTDYQGRAVRLTEERRKHILLHREMVGMEPAMEETVRAPQLVIRSRSDASASLSYRFYRRTRVGDKWLCVVVKIGEDDAFVVTAYLTDKPRQGVIVWPQNP